LKIKKSTAGTLAGTAAGALYFAIGEKGIPKQSNASYLSPVSTDLAAWAFGGVLVWKGIQYDDFFISFIGGAVIAIHISQFAAHKVIKNRRIKK